MKDTTMAGFRIERETWEEFQSFAKGRGGNASSMLKSFIEICLSGGLDEDSVLAAALNPPEIDPEVEKAIANAIRPLEHRVKSLEALLASIPDGFRYPDDVKDFVTSAPVGREMI